MYILVTCGDIEKTSHLIKRFPLEGETIANTLFVQFYSDGDANFGEGFYLTFNKVPGMVNL